MKIPICSEPPTNMKVHKSFWIHNAWLFTVVYFWFLPFPSLSFHRALAGPFCSRHPNQPSFTSIKDSKLFAIVRTLCPHISCSRCMIKPNYHTWDTKGQATKPGFLSGERGICWERSLIQCFRGPHPHLHEHPTYSKISMIGDHWSHTVYIYIFIFQQYTNYR